MRVYSAGDSQLLNHALDIAIKYRVESVYHFLDGLVQHHAAQVLTGSAQPTKKDLTGLLAIEQKRYRLLQLQGQGYQMIEGLPQMLRQFTVLYRGNPNYTNSLDAIWRATIRLLDFNQGRKQQLVAMQWYAYALDGLLEPRIIANNILKSIDSIADNLYGDSSEVSSLNVAVLRLYLDISTYPSADNLANCLRLSTERDAIRQFMQGGDALDILQARLNSCIEPLCFSNLQVGKIKNNLSVQDLAFNSYFDDDSDWDKFVAGLSLCCFGLIFLFPPAQVTAGMALFGLMMFTLFEVVGGGIMLLCVFHNEPEQQNEIGATSSSLFPPQSVKHKFSENGDYQSACGMSCK